MAVNWCQHVDGVTIFPKLPVYLRTHHTAWTRNQRVKEAVRKAAPGEAVLARLNEKTQQELLPCRYHIPEPARPSPAVTVAVEAATAAAPPVGPSVAGGGASSFKGVREDPAGSSAMPWCASIRVDGAQGGLGPLRLRGCRRPGLRLPRSPPRPASEPPVGQLPVLCPARAHARGCPPC